MSGGITLSAVASYAAIAGAAVTAGTAIAGAVGGASKLDPSGALSKITGAASKNANARSALLETAGQSGGSPLAPGTVGGANGTLFGN